MHSYTSTPPLGLHSLLLVELKGHLTEFSNLGEQGGPAIEGSPRLDEKGKENSRDSALEKYRLKYY